MCNFEMVQTDFDCSIITVIWDIRKLITSVAPSRWQPMLALTDIVSSIGSDRFDDLSLGLVESPAVLKRYAERRVLMLLEVVEHCACGQSRLTEHDLYKFVARGREALVNASLPLAEYDLCIRPDHFNVGLGILIDAMDIASDEMEKNVSSIRRTLASSYVHCGQGGRSVFGSNGSAPSVQIQFHGQWFF